jgi:NAD(P)H-flavin reductase
MFLSILENRVIAPEVYLLRLGPVSPPQTWLPGQWASLHLPVGPHPPLVRAYSLAAPADGSGVMDLVFDVVDGGMGTEYLAALKPGDHIEMAGIYGKFVLPDPMPRHILFAARHTGIVPVRCIVESLKAMPNPPRVTLVQGAGQPEWLLYRDEFTALAKSQGWFSYYPTVLTPGGLWDGTEGDELALLRALPETETPYTPMLSGVRAFTQSVRAYYTGERGLERRAVKVENFD